MPNIGRNAVAKSMGTGKRIEPPQSEIIRQVRRMTEGTEIRTVVNWKKVATTLPMPVRYMWWAQTMKERKASVSTPYTIDL